jgi:hypothetical protein
MQIKCFIKSYTQERTFVGRNGERVVRDMVLTKVSDNPLVAEKYPNEFYAAYFHHIDDDVLYRAANNKTAFVFDLSFRVTESQDGKWLHQRVAIENIAEG